MKISVRIDTSRLRDKAARFRRAFTQQTDAMLTALAHEAVAELDVPSSWRGGRAFNAIKDLGAVFVPVILKHLRRERWPDVQAIYEGRAGQGNRFFWVEAAKLAALRQRLAATALNQIATGQWSVSVERLDFTLRVTVRKNGRFQPGDAAAAEEIRSYIRARFAEIAGAALRTSLRTAGFT